METPASISGIGAAGSSRNQTPMQIPEAVQGCGYEVFLSFRGPDTRIGIADYLYCSLKEAGIRTFRDKEELRIGEEIAPEILGAIEQSKISIPIFSKGYTSSTWCLNELAHMVKCRKRKEQIIMPIFYYVEPSEVRNQQEGYGKALLEHENKRRLKDDTTIRKWREALKEVGGLKGWDITKEANRFLIILTLVFLINLHNSVLHRDCVLLPDTKKAFHSWCLWFKRNLSTNAFWFIYGLSGQCMREV